MKCAEEKLLFKPGRNTQYEITEFSFTFILYITFSCSLYMHTRKYHIVWWLFVFNSPSAHHFVNSSEFCI